MRKLLKLYKMLNKNSRMLPETTQKKGLNMSLDGLTLPAIGIAVSAFLCYMVLEWGDLIELVGGLSTLVSILGSFVAVVIIFVGAMNLINNLYMSSDIEILITLPFSAEQIVILRVLSFFQIVFVGSLLAILPPSALYVILFDVPLSQLIGVVVTAILIPFFSLAILATVIILLMSVFKFFRSKEVLRFIGIALLFLLVCVAFFFSSGDSEGGAQAVIIKAADLLDSFKYLIPVNGFCIDFMKNGNILYLAFALLCTVASLVALVIIAKVFYLNGALNMQDASSGRVLSDKVLDKYCKQSSVMKSLIRKEFRSVRRNPVYFLNNFIIGALWPVLVLILFRGLIPIFKDMLNEGILDELTGPFDPGVFALMSSVFTFLALFLACVPMTYQNLAYTSLSREGNSFMIMKQIPVSYEIQLEAKRRMASRVLQVSVTSYITIILLIMSIMMKQSPLYCLIPMIILYLFVEFQVNLDMYFGIKNTDVSWDNEKTITFKPVLMRFLPLIYIALVGVGFMGWFAILFEDTTSLLIGLALICAVGVILFVASFILKKMIMRSGEKMIRKLRF